MLTVTKSVLIRQKLMDLLGVAGSTALLTLMRRRVLNDQQLADLGLVSTSCGVTKSWLPAEAEEWLPNDANDIGWAISVVESRFYQTNVLLRDSDANGMAHGLEIRVPFLDQRLLKFAHSLPGSIRFPSDKPSKYLLREAHREILDENLLKRPKSGFTMPLRRWMLGPLRPICEKGLQTLKQSGLVRPEGVDTVWSAFLADPESQIWSRVLTLVALGDFMDRHQLAIH